ncbi:DNA-binding protein [Parabacteroides sp. PF5-6]|uniref:HU family DNA-binding protein n=1 Tax=Parabacteroides sp. PF5-6 TaxID=1742403 RepID=UPI002406CBE2|nr:DNA-binding protein [Parabacteroides sp. PF5-6]MDF9829474.1 putative histone-like DNA-binding protein [Parabacteroides sp. PF5-6]
MAIKFKLVKCNNLGQDKKLYPYKYHAREVYSETVLFDELIHEIAEAGTPSNQVKAVLDRMSHLMRKHMSEGRIVQFDDFGNFRYCIGSPGFASEEDFDITQIRPPRLVFSPGKTLRKSIQKTTFKSQKLYEMEINALEQS